MSCVPSPVLGILLGISMSRVQAPSLEFEKRATPSGAISIDLPKNWRTFYGESGQLGRESFIWEIFGTADLGVLQIWQSVPNLKLEMIARREVPRKEDTDSFILASFPRPKENFDRSIWMYSFSFGGQPVSEEVSGFEVFKLNLADPRPGKQKTFQWFLIPVNRGDRTYILSFTFPEGKVFEIVKIITRAIESLKFQAPPSPTALRAQKMGPGG